MTLTTPIITKPSAALMRGENARVEIHRDLNGGCKLVVKDSRHPEGYTVGLSPDSAIGLAMEMMEAVGVPIKEAFAAKMKQVQQKG